VKVQQNGPRRGQASATRKTVSERESTESADPGQLADGQRRRFDVLATLRARNASRVRRAQCVMLTLLLERGRCTIDDVRDALGPAGSDPARWLGSVPAELRRAGIIRRAGYAETRRAVAHARPVSVWELADRAAALHWLAGHPEPGDLRDPGEQPDALPAKPVRSPDATNRPPACADVSPLFADLAYGAGGAPRVSER
jgi:hypothetical protein